jgi:hypothetical protein
MYPVAGGSSWSEFSRKSGKKSLLVRTFGVNRVSNWRPVKLKKWPKV